MRKMGRCNSGKECKKIWDKFYICKNCGLIALSKKEMEKLMKKEKCRNNKQHEIEKQEIEICKYCGALYTIIVVTNVI